MNLTDKALLAQLNISQWTAKKLDRKITEEVAINHQAATTAGTYRKALLPASEQLAAIHAKTSQIRFRFYDNTLPWGLDGIQMLPSANYLAFMTDFRNEKALWETLVADFLLVYDQLVIDAKTSRGSMYNEKDYPSKDIVAAKFGMSMTIMPVPGDDFRVEVGEEELATIRSEVRASVVASMKGALIEVWQRLYDKVDWLVDRLSDPKNTFKVSMYEQMLELCELVPRLNFADDPDLEAFRVEVDSKLARHHPESLRNDPDLRRETYNSAVDIKARMLKQMEKL